ncbi:hypothetical protein Spa11_36270 [Botrimarina mediterranea]|uniref:Uncharacterized protein n=1 Tax=Botrimarina mediterranea TaxID=2528022 RepID=A0A518KC84_9BACT|nr:hypothetical protein Spa11_36270 [Botrimarina mediterranea]
MTASLTEVGDALREEAHLHRDHAGHCESDVVVAQVDTTVAAGEATGVTAWAVTLDAHSLHMTHGSLRVTSTVRLNLSPRRAVRG